ncbi:MAG: hypothetical protein QW292_05770 [Candidatus Parvarchaeota archaeon]
MKTMAKIIPIFLVALISLMSVAAASNPGDIVGQNFTVYHDNKIVYNVTFNPGFNTGHNPSMDMHLPPGEYKFVYSPVPFYEADYLIEQTQTYILIYNDTDAILYEAEGSGAGVTAYYNLTYRNTTWYRVNLFLNGQEGIEWGQGQQAAFYTSNVTLNGGFGSGNISITTIWQDLTNGITNYWFWIALTIMGAVLGALLQRQHSRNQIYYIRSGHSGHRRRRRKR